MTLITNAHTHNGLAVIIPHTCSVSYKKKIIEKKNNNELTYASNHWYMYFLVSCNSWFKCSK